MKQQRFQTDKAPHVTVKSCAGDLIVRSWMETAVLVKGEATVEEVEGGLTLTSRDDLQLFVPAAAHLALESVSGDVLLKNLEGDAYLQEVSGDAVLVNLATVKIGVIHADMAVRNVSGTLGIEAVHGDLAVRNVSGDFACQALYGDIAARNITGAVALGQVSGDVNLATVNGPVSIGEAHRDVNLNNLGGPVALPNVHGDIRLRGGLSADKHTLTADGDIVLRWPADAPLNLTATAPQIKNRLPLEEVVQTDDTLTGRIGDGATFVTLKAAGRIVLKESEMVDEKWADYRPDVDVDFSLGMEDLAAQVTAQIDAQMGRFKNEFQDRFGPEFAEKFAKKAEKAAAQAEKAAERVRRRAEAYRRPAAPPPPSPPKPPRQPVSPEEQMKILKMVEQGVISPDEANELLEALQS